MPMYDHLVLTVGRTCKYDFTLIIRLCYRSRYFTDIIKPKIILGGPGLIRQSPSKAILEVRDGSSSSTLLYMERPTRQGVADGFWDPVFQSSSSKKLNSVNELERESGSQMRLVLRPTPWLQCCETLSKGSTYPCSNSRSTETCEMINLCGFKLPRLWEVVMYHRWLI